MNAPGWTGFAGVPASRLLGFLDGLGSSTDLLAVAKSLPLRRFVGLARG